MLPYSRQYAVIYLEELKTVTRNLKDVAFGQIDSRTEHLPTRNQYSVTTTKFCLALSLFLQRKLQDKCSNTEISSEFKIWSQTEEN
jgi:hypothetical protein